MDINCIITLQLKMYITKTCKSYSEVFARGKKVIDFWSTYKATYVLPIEKKVYVNGLFDRRHRLINLHYQYIPIPNMAKLQEKYMLW